MRPTPPNRSAQSRSRVTAAGRTEGLALMDEANGAKTLEHYYLYHASRADLLRRLDRKDEATTAYRRALALATNQVEQQYLRRRLGEVSDSNGHHPNNEKLV